jgi:hypothetical protein
MFLFACWLVVSFFRFRGANGLFLNPRRNTLCLL